MRIAVGAYTVCTNSFSHERTDVASCEAATRVGQNVLAPHRRQRTAIGGFWTSRRRQEWTSSPFRSSRPVLAAP